LNHNLKKLKKTIGETAINSDLAVWLEGFEKELRELFNTERKNNAEAYPHTFAVVVFLEKEILGE